MSSVVSKDDFVALLTGCQTRLHAYILSLTGDLAHADDVLQKTNLVLWKKSAEFAKGSNFNGWACKVAYYEVLAHRRDLGRDRHLFDDELLGSLADEARRQVDETDDRRLALTDCIQRLSGRDLELIRGRYEPASTIDHLADRFGRTKSAIVSSLFRIRRNLLECVDRRLAGRVD
jgi:RNA polymerase sigma-70 factor (ECF subfamily)